MQLDVLNSKGEVTGRKVELPEDIFNIEPNDHVIYLAVKQYRAAQRLGLHSTKTRAEVKGASRKLHKQKGTGGARKGNIRNPLYKGGGTINGPKPHGYGFKLNRKVKDLAKISALSHKARANQIVVVEDLSIDTPKTKTFVDVLGKVSKNARKTLLVLPEYDTNVYLSARNIASNKTVVLSDMNTYDLVNANVVILTESTAKFFTEEAIEVVEG
ncbi:MAG: 50S ribosomal protein L4 [Chitinophagaceae bacterium]|nr:50S ribosomal protein L4 [Chitinophagaceae bacterium]